MPVNRYILHRLRHYLFTPFINQMFCYFCQKNIDSVDYKDIQLLSRFISGFYKIKPRKKTGLCSHHQRKIATAVKQARQMGMLPYAPR